MLRRMKGVDSVCTPKAKRLDVGARLVHDLNLLITRRKAQFALRLRTASGSLEIGRIDNPFSRSFQYQV